MSNVTIIHTDIDIIKENHAKRGFYSIILQVFLQQEQLRHQ